MRILSMVLLIFLAASPGFAQTQARQATPEDLGQEPDVTEEVNDPMLLEISLGGDEKRKPLGDPGVTGRTYYDQKRFVVDKARVPKITVTKRPGKKGRLVLEVAPTITTGWYRQDLDVTVAVVGADGKVVKQVVWDDITVGRDDSWANKMGAWAAGAASTSRRTAELEFEPGEFEALFLDGKAPSLRMILDVQGEPEEDE
jgi:hypothetical protein